MNRHIALLLLLLIASFNLFWNISQQAMAPFDESRHAASAVEMLRSHQFLVNTYRGAPDYWNAKPPLTFWTAALGLQLSSNPFLGVRLFSLLSALATTLLAFLYARRISGARAGLLAAAFFITTPALILLHGARTADPDMVYTLFITAAFLAFSVDRRIAFIAGYMLLGLAFLAKSFHVAPYGLAALLYIGWRWRKGELGLVDLWLPPLFFLVPVLPWAIARYQVDGTVFFQCMFLNDVLRRSTQVIENHNAPIYVYIIFLLREFGLAVIAAGIGLRLAISSRVFADRRVLLTLLWLIVPLIVYSLAKSRMESYTYPLLPPCAILLALTLDKGLALLDGRKRKIVIALIVLSLINNEAFIAYRILKRNKTEDAVLPAMNIASATAGKQTIPLYIESVPDLMQMPQHYYSTSLLLGNITLEDGGRSGYIADPQGVLITTDGQVLRHQTLSIGK